MLFWIAPIPLGRFYQVPAHRLGLQTGFTPAAAALFYLGIAVQFFLYYLAYRRLRRDPRALAPAALIGMPLIAGLGLLAAAPVTSSDIYYYIMSGHLFADFGLNPLIFPPAARPNDPLLGLVFWRNLPAPYGPLWAYQVGCLRWLAGPDLLANLLAHKVVQLAGLFTAAGIVGRIALRTDRPRARMAAFLVLWNPLALWEAAGAGHNGLFTMALVLMALLALAGRRLQYLAIPLITLGALFKVVPLIFLPLVAFWLMVQPGAGHHTWRRVGFGAAVAAALVALSLLPIWRQLGGLGLLREMTFYSYSAGALAIAQLAPALGRDRAATAVRILAYALFAWIYVAQLRRTGPDHGALRRSAFYLHLAFLLVATLWFEPWYAIGPLLLAATTAERFIETQTILFTFGAMAAYVTRMSAHFLFRQPQAPVWLQAAAFALTAGPLLAYVLYTGARSRRFRLPLGLRRATLPAPAAE